MVVGTAVFGAPRFCIFLLKNAVFSRVFFARCKRFLRAHRACPRSKSHYGLYLGEFLYRSQYLGINWRNAALFEIVRVLRVQNKPPISETAFEWGDIRQTFLKLEDKYRVPRRKMRRGVRGRRPSVRRALVPTSEPYDMPRADPQAAQEPPQEVGVVRG